MASVRNTLEVTVDRPYTIVAVLITAGVALIVGIVIGMLISGNGISIPGSSAFSALTGSSAESSDLRQGGR